PCRTERIAASAGKVGGGGKDDNVLRASANARGDGLIELPEVAALDGLVRSAGKSDRILDDDEALARDSDAAGAVTRGRIRRNEIGNRSSSCAAAVRQCDPRIRGAYWPSATGERGVGEYAQAAAGKVNAVGRRERESAVGAGLDDGKDLSS